jgi:hypothetical protein
VNRSAVSVNEGTRVDNGKQPQDSCLNSSVSQCDYLVSAMADMDCCRMVCTILILVVFLNPKSIIWLFLAMFKWPS